MSLPTMIKSLIFFAFILSTSINAEEVDYLKERLSLAESESYEPYALYTTQIVLLEEHFKRGQESSASIQDINEPLQQLAELYPLSIQANFAVAGFLEFVIDSSEDKAAAQQLVGVAKKKRKKAQSILDSILLSGDGTAFSTAYKVINLAEEDAVLNHLKLTKVSFSVHEEDGKYFDILSVSDPQGKAKNIYFDISLFYEKSPLNKPIKRD